MLFFYFYLGRLWNSLQNNLLFQFGGSVTNLGGELTHAGRPRDEDPHVKRSVKKKQERIDYLVRVDLVSQVDLVNV